MGKVPDSILKERYGDISMPGEMALRMRCKSMGLQERAGGLEDQPYALMDAFLILDVVEAEFWTERRRVKGS